MIEFEDFQSPASVTFFLAIMTTKGWPIIFLK